MDINRIVAGLDVHKDSVFLCIMRHDEAIIFEKTYGTLTTQLRQMRDDMLRHSVTECAMESTAVYWVPVWNELCEHMILRLANPHFIKQLPGRKSDTKYAQWIAECQKALAAMCEEHFSEQHKRLQTIPGVKERYNLYG
ncbi:transposase [Phocaeicola sp.]|uniref:IS110 family transposase n=1 Tax=Phocaeicola sp. TaxID=2773926 RepID=UPI0026363069|nr:transposase [Phocaeicola sp.]